VRSIVSTVAILSDPVQFIADTENIEIETAMTSNLRLRDTISSLTANDRQQVIRICICSDSMWLLYCALLLFLNLLVAWFILGVIKEILNEIRNAAFELSIPESCILPDEIDQPFTVVRREKSLSDKGMFFDIVVLFGRTSSNAELDPHSLITNCDDILLPGGTLVLSSFDCNGSACSVPVNGASDSIGDKPSTLDTAEYVMVLHQMGYSILHTSHSPAPFGFTIDAQKATWKPDLTVKSELLDEDAFVFNYTFGGEDQLQWDFSGLNPSQELEIWILAVDGRDTAAGLGLARALRREYLFWTIRFVSFPATFSQEMQMDALWSLPSCMREEKDIIFSQTGDPLVPRLAPLYAPAPSQLQTRLRSSICNLDPDYAIAHIQHTSRFPYFSAFVGSVIQVNPDFEDFHPGSLVVGLQDQASVGRSTICLESTCVVPMDMSFDKLVDHIPGVIISVLGPGINTYNRSRRIHALSVLVTHCDTLIGSTVCEMYTRDGLKFSRARQDISILDLARMGNERFDLIISGYEDAMHSQVLRTLLRPSKGKLFLWHHELPIILRDDPLSIGIALRAAGSIQFLRPRDGPWPRITLDADMDHLGDSTGAVFDAKKTYVILGGIGSLGASIAVFLFQVSARNPPSRAVRFLI
jgi:hypothetical protein